MFFIKINELFIIILRNKTYRGFKMIKIDNKKIIVSSFDELKEVLEEYNTYNYIFLMNDISITEDIFIEAFKDAIVFKDFSDNLIVLDNTPSLVITVKIMVVFP